MAFVLRSFSWSLLGLSLWVIYAIWVAVFVWQLKLHVLTGLLVYGGVVVLIMYAVALRYFSTERIVRPVLRDIAAHVLVTLEKTRRRLSLRARMLVALPAINVVTAVVADAATHHGEGHLKALVYVLLVGTGVAASVSLILT